MRLWAGTVAIIAFAASCGGSGGTGTGGIGGGSTGAAGQGGGAGGTTGSAGQGGGAPHCGNPTAVVSCYSTSASTGDACEEAYTSSAANATRLLCSGQDKTLTEGAACPRNAQFAGCCADPGMLANCYYTQAGAQDARTSCAQAGGTWCDP